VKLVNGFDNEATVRPALRCSVVVADRKSLPDRVIIRTCHGKPVRMMTFNGDAIFAVCQRHRHRLQSVGVKVRN
jgi:hypothetical protein